jgi:hypothetical protein
MRKLMIFSNCLEVIKRMKAKNFRPYSAILPEIEIRLRNFELVSFQHESRDYNENFFHKENILIS